MADIAEGQQLTVVMTCQLLDAGEQADAAADGMLESRQEDTAELLAADTGLAEAIAEYAPQTTDTSAKAAIASTATKSPRPLEEDWDTTASGAECLVDALTGVTDGSAGAIADISEAARFRADHGLDLPRRLPPALALSGGQRATARSKSVSRKGLRPVTAADAVDPAEAASSLPLTTAPGAPPPPPPPPPANECLLAGREPPPRDAPGPSPGGSRGAMAVSLVEGHRECSEAVAPLVERTRGATPEAQPAEGADAMEESASAATAPTAAVAGINASALGDDTVWPTSPRVLADEVSPPPDGSGQAPKEALELDAPQEPDVDGGTEGPWEAGESMGGVVGAAQAAGLHATKGILDFHVEAEERGPRWPAEGSTPGDAIGAMVSAEAAAEHDPGASAAADGLEEAAGATASDTGSCRGDPGGDGMVSTALAEAAREAGLDEMAATSGSSMAAGRSGPNLAAPGHNPSEKTAADNTTVELRGCVQQPQEAEAVGPASAGCDSGTAPEYPEGGVEAAAASVESEDIPEAPPADGAVGQAHEDAGSEAEPEIGPGVPERSESAAEVVPRHCSEPGRADCGTPRPHTCAEKGPQGRSAGGTEDRDRTATATASPVPPLAPDLYRGPVSPGAVSAAAAVPRPDSDLPADTGISAAASKLNSACSSSAAAARMSTKSQPEGPSLTPSVVAHPKGLGVRAHSRASSGASADTVSGWPEIPAVAVQAMLEPTMQPASPGRAAQPPAEVQTFHGASTAAGQAASPESPKEIQMDAAHAFHPTDPHPPGPHGPHDPAKPKSYAELYTARRTEAASSSADAAVAITAAAEAVSRHTAETPLWAPGRREAVPIGGPDLAGYEGRGSGSVERGSSSAAMAGSTAGAAVKPQEQVPWLNTDNGGEEFDLIAKVEAEALQLGLKIYARDGGHGVAVQGPVPGVAGDGEEEHQEQEDSLQAIMAMGRRPSEIAELLLGGEGAASVAGEVSGREEEEKRRWRKQEVRERKRALRREQKQQQRQRRRALMGLDPDPHDGSGDESSSSSSSASSSSRVLHSIRGSPSRAEDRDGSTDCNGGGEIYTADIRRVLLLRAADPATGSAGVHGSDGSNGGDGAAMSPGVKEDVMAGGGRILTSAGAAAALGLELLCAPAAPQDPISPWGGGAAFTSNASGIIPSYLLNTPPPPRSSDGMTFQPRPGSDYPSSIAPTTTNSDAFSILSRMGEGTAGGPLPSSYSEDTGTSASAGGDSGVAGHGHSGGGGDDPGRRAAPAAATGSGPEMVKAAVVSDREKDADEQFLVERDERSRKIAEQLAALQEESRLLQQQSMLLQERTREISRSVGLPTPSQLSGGVGSTVVALQWAAAPKPRAPDAPVRDTRSAAAARLLPPVGHRTPSPVLAEVAAPSQAALGAVARTVPPPTESRTGSNAERLDRSSLRPQPSPISWALPNRNAPVPAPCAFPSPPKGTRRAQVAQAHAEMQRTGSTSSLADSLLPRWAEQVESTVMTPVVGRHPKPVPLAPLLPSQARPPAGGVGEARANGAGVGKIRGTGAAAAGPPPQPLLQHVLKGWPGVAPAAGTATGRGHAGPKSKLAPAAAAVGAQRAKPPPPQQQVLPAPSQPPVGLPDAAELYRMAQEQQQQQMFSGALSGQVLPQQHQPSLPPDWVAAPLAAPPGIPLALPIPPPQSPLSMHMVSGGGIGPVLPSFESLGTRATVPTAAATGPKRAAGAGKAPLRIPKPVKGPATRNGGGGANSNGGPGDGSHVFGSSNGQLAMMPSVPPQWPQVPEQGLLGMMPFIPQPYHGGAPQPVEPWMAIPPGQLLPVVTGCGAASDCSPEAAPAAVVVLDRPISPQSSVGSAPATLATALLPAIPPLLRSTLPSKPLIARQALGQGYWGISRSWVQHPLDF